MKVRNIKISFEEYENSGELPKVDQQLLENAKRAIDSSYAPYSAFHVGAAILLENGEVVTGSNQENGAYPSGLCAERVALFHAKHQYPDAIVKTLAITAHADHFDVNYPITPCGACRQVIAEVQGRQSNPIRIILKGETGKVQVLEGIENLLPLMFKEEKLKRTNSKKKK
jgi:cytidine deaminase